MSNVIAESEYGGILRILLCLRQSYLKTNTIFFTITSGYKKKIFRAYFCLKSVHNYHDHVSSEEELLILILRNLNRLDFSHFDSSALRRRKPLSILKMDLSN